MRNLLSVFTIVFLSLGLFGCGTTSTKIQKTHKKTKIYLDKVGSKVVKAKPQGKNSCVHPDKANHKKWKALVEQANQCVQADNTSRLEKYAKLLAENHPMGPWGAYFLSLVAEKRGQVEKAFWMIDLALKKAPNEGLLNYHKARLLYADNEYDSAVRLFEKALKSRGDLIGARVFLGQIYYRDQDFNLAKKHFSKALEIDSSISSAWVGLAECELEDKNGEAALVALEKAIRFSPKNIDLKVREAFIYEQVLKDPVEALKVYRQIQRAGKKWGLALKVNQQVQEKVKELKLKISKMKSSEKLSKRKPALQEGVSQ